MRTRQTPAPLFPRVFAGGASFVLAMGLAQPFSHAQDFSAAEQFTLETYEPGDPSSNILGVETSGVPDHLAPVAGVTIHRSERPLAWRGQDQVREIADDRYTVDIGFGLGLFDRLLLDARLATVVSQTGTGIGNAGSVASYGSGDLRLRLKAKFFQTNGSVPIGVSLHGAAYGPTGEAKGFVTDGAWRFEPRLSTDARIGLFTIAANVAYQVRQARVVGNNYIHDDAVRWGVAGRMPLGYGLGIDGSVYGSSVVGSAAVRGAQRPIEAMGGFHFRRAGLHLGFAAGGAVTSGVGAPRHRILGTVSYSPEAKPELAGRPMGPLDADLDGIINRDDECRHEPETYDGFQDEDGCPDLDDDGDGVADIDDACPELAGIAEKAGCPFVDEDRDMVDDAVDRCPRQRGWPRFDGCERPPLKRTARIPRYRPASSDEVEMIKVVEQIPEAVFFGTAEADFKPDEHPLVGRLAERLKRDESIVILQIEGHTDSRGPDEMNVALGADRAETVRKVLLRRGVAPDRLEVISYGETRPLDDNETEQGRGRNRRVAFRIIRQIPNDKRARQILLTIDDLRIDDRYRGVGGTVLDGARVGAPAGWKCTASDEPPAPVVVVLAPRAPEIAGMLYPGWTAETELRCEKGADVARIPLNVEVPSFAIASPRMSGENLLVSSTNTSTLMIKVAATMPDLQVSVRGLRPDIVKTGPDAARVRLRPEEPSEADGLSLGSHGRPLLTIPVEVIEDGRPEVDPPPRRIVEVGVGTSVLASGRSIAEPSRSKTALPSVHFTGRILANRWFSAGLAADIGPTLGLDPILFTPGFGAHVTLHAPLEILRPFLTTGAAAWFPGVLRARPAFDLTTGVDIEPTPGAGVRIGARMVTMAYDGEPIYLGGGSLSAYTSF